MAVNKKVTASIFVSARDVVILNNASMPRVRGRQQTARRQRIALQGSDDFVAAVRDYKRLKFRPKVVSVLHNSDRNFTLASLDATEYRITSSDTVAACSE